MIGWLVTLFSRRRPTTTVGRVVNLCGHDRSAVTLAAADRSIILLPAADRSVVNLPARAEESTCRH